MRTDSDSPSACPYPPQAEKIRSHPFSPFHPFYNHVAFSEERRSLKKRGAQKRRDRRVRRGE